MSSPRTTAHLRDLAGPDLYRRNAFRITGLSTTADPRDIRQRRQQFGVAWQVGTQLTDDGPVPLPAPASEPQVRAAFDILADPRQRIIHELFWLWGVTSKSSCTCLNAAHARHDAAVRARTPGHWTWKPTANRTKNRISAGLLVKGDHFVERCCGPSQLGKPPATPDQHPRRPAVGPRRAARPAARSTAGAHHPDRGTRRECVRGQQKTPGEPSPLVGPDGGDDRCRRAYGRPGSGSGDRRFEGCTGIIRPQRPAGSRGVGGQEGKTGLAPGRAGGRWPRWAGSDEPPRWSTKPRSC